MIRKILVATDGSKQAMNAVEYAVGLAGQAGYSLLVPAVIDRSFLVAQSMHSSATSTKFRVPVLSGADLRGAKFDEAHASLRRKGD